MSDNNGGHCTASRATGEVDELRRRLLEAEQTLEAIRHGDVDALVVTGPQGERVYSLTGAEHIYRVTVETMKEAALTLDPDGTILFCNQRFCDLMRTAARATIGRPITRFVARPQVPSLQKLLARARVSAVHQRLTLQAADGRAVPVQLAASPLPAGDSLSICLVASDLTELEESAHSIRVLREHEEAMQAANERLQVQMEQLYTLNDMLQTRQGQLETANEELRLQEQELRAQGQALCQSEQRFHAIYQYGGVGIALADLQGRLTFVNPALEKMLGYEEGELIGRNFRDITCDKDLPAEEVYLAELHAGRRDYYRIEKRYLRKSGEAIWITLSGSLLRESDGRPAFGLAMIQDIAEHKRAEEALRELNATLESKVAQRTTELAHRAKQLQKLTLELTQAEEQERRRIAVLLHEDLQQQIAGAKFHLHLVQGKVKDDRLRADLEEVGDILKGAIEQSRNLSRDLSPAVVNMNDLAEVLRWLAQWMRTQQGLTVRLVVSGDLKLHSEPLTMFLFRAAREMLFNVIKHAQVREAAVRVRRIGRYVCLCVSDPGRGFDPRGLQETAGVGLFSIRERAELLGGRLTVQSVPGQGSRFHLIVPDGSQMVGVGPRAYPLAAPAGSAAYPAPAGTDSQKK